jgi:WD40 repeat protein
MKSIKNALVGGIVLGALLGVAIQLHSMKPSEVSLKSRRRGVQPVQQAQPERYKSNIVWVKTSDNVFLEVPQWQTDQMKVLQQNGDNSKDNPADASMISSDQLVLIQQALQTASKLEEFRKFYSDLSDDEQKSLLADAFTLGMQGLASLLITYMFPKELQEKMGASALQPASMMISVVKYLKNIQTLPLSHTGLVHHVAFSPDGKRIIAAVAGTKNNLVLYDVTRGTQKSLLQDTTIVNDVVFSSDGQYIAAALFNTVVVCNGYTGQVIKIMGRYESYWPICVNFNFDNSSIIVGSDNLYELRSGPSSNLVLYDIKTGNEIEKFEFVSAPLFSIACSLDGKYIVAGTNKRYVERVILLDATNGRWVRAFKGLADGKVCVAISHDSNFIVAGSSGGDELVLWDVETGQERAILKGHSGRVHSVTFSPDGKYIVSGSSGDQNNVIVWDGKTGELIEKIEGFKEDIHCVAISSDGSYLLCGGIEGLKLLNFIESRELNYIATQLNSAQARFLYRLYLAKINNAPVVLDSKDLDYQLFMTFPKDVQRVIKAFLPFENAPDATEKAVQEKMNELRLSLFYVPGYWFGKTEKTRDEKIKAIKDAMQNMDENSTSYKACERLLLELEQEAAFEV